MSSDDNPDEQHLERSLNTPLLAIYGAGTILGAGIYVLVGEVAGEAGYWLPLAFLLAAAVAGINGMSYAELASRRPSAGGPSAYIEEAFRPDWFWRAIGWMIVATGVVSAATIANGFAGYLGHFVDVPQWLAKAGMLIALGALAAVGARESAWFMAITTTLGTVGLLFVIYVGLIDPPDSAPGVGALLDAAPTLADAGTLMAVVTAGYLAVYAYIGFEDMVHMAEEVERPGRAMPIAILTAVGVAALLYVLVSIAALAVVEPRALADSDAPLVAVVEQAGYPGWPLALLSLWLILNGALAQLIMASRVIYHSGQKGGVVGPLGRLNHRTRTPLLATVAATAVAVVLALFFPLKTLAAATSTIILLVFAASNWALIRLERREPEAPFDTPVWLPWLALLTCVAVLAATFLLPGGGGH